MHALNKRGPQVYPRFWKTTCSSPADERRVRSLALTLALTLLLAQVARRCEHSETIQGKRTSVLVAFPLHMICRMLRLANRPAWTGNWKSSDE